MSMTMTGSERRPAFGFWLVAALGLAWNAIGAAFFLGQVGVFGGAFAPLPDQPVLPGWVMVAYSMAIRAPVRSGRRGAS